MNAAVILMIASVVLMVVIVTFLLLVNRRVERLQREQLLGDIRHVRIPDDARALTGKRHRPKPPYRPF